MMDNLTKEKRSSNMRAIRNKDTLPEVIVRKLIYSYGYRYRLHRKDLPGKPDLVFGSRKKVIFINGCFWHQHLDCKKSNVPKSNISYWLPKLQRNVERDSSNQAHLINLGWLVLVIWECEIKNKDTLILKIIDFLED